jgi:hypothetical protein
MSDIPFHQTPMGRDFFDRTMPELVKQLARIAALLEKLAERDAQGGR